MMSLMRIDGEPSGPIPIIPLLTPRTDEIPVIYRKPEGYDLIVTQMLVGILGICAVTVTAAFVVMLAVAR
jgi:hypothetical protein